MGINSFQIHGLRGCAPLIIREPDISNWMKPLDAPLIEIAFYSSCSRTQKLFLFVIEIRCYLSILRSVFALRVLQLHQTPSVHDSKPEEEDASAKLTSIQVTQENTEIVNSDEKNIAVNVPGAKLQSLIWDDAVRRSDNERHSPSSALRDDIDDDSSERFHEYEVPPPPYVAEQPRQETLPKAGLGKLQPAGHIRPTATFHPSREQAEDLPMRRRTPPSSDDENKPHDPPPSIADTEIERDFSFPSSSVMGEETTPKKEKPAEDLPMRRRTPPSSEDENKPHDPPPSKADSGIERDFSVCSSSIVETMQESEKPNIAVNVSGAKLQSLIRDDAVRRSDNERHSPSSALRDDIDDDSSERFHEYEGPPPPYVAEQPRQETLPKAGLGKLQPAGHIRPTATFHPSCEQEDFVYDDENQPHDPPPSIADTEIEQDFRSSSVMSKKIMITVYQAEDLPMRRRTPPSSEDENKPHDPPPSIADSGIERDFSVCSSSVMGEETTPKKEKPTEDLLMRRRTPPSSDDENKPHDPPPSIADSGIERDFSVCSSSIVGEETMQESEKPTTIPSFLPRQRDEFIDNSFNPFSFTVGRNGCVVKTPYAEIIFPCDAVDEKIEITVRPDYYRLKEKLIDDSRIYVSPEIFFESKDEMTFKNEVTIYLEVMYSAIDPDDPLILNVERIDDGVVEKYLKLEHGQGTKAEFKVNTFCGFCISALKSEYPKAKRHFYSIICLRQPPKETPTHHHVHWYIFDHCEIEHRSKTEAIKKLGFYTLGLPESFAVKYGRNIRLRFQSNRKVRIASRKVELVQFWGDPLSRDEKFTIDGNKIDLSGGEDDEEPVIKYTITEIDASNEETSVVLDNSVPFSWLVPAYKTEFVMKGDNSVGVQNTYYEHTRMEIPAKQTPHSGQVAQNPNEGNAVDAVYQGQSCDIQERRFNQCPAGGAIGGHNPDDHRRNARINYGSMPSQRYNPTSQGQLTSDDRAHSSQGQNVVGYNSTETVDYKNNEEHLHSNQHQLPGNRSKDFENEQQMGESSGQRIPKLSDSKSSGGSRKKEKGKKGWKRYLQKK
uniref:uncharacterized protein LOC120341708 n=1 Tax=Styela clava TaxID=7725 RepID=UPI00193ACF7E|nr:uncharacterized protein LOC120341708 [Styela clava]